MTQTTTTPSLAQTAYDSVSHASDLLDLDLSQGQVTRSRLGDARITTVTYADGSRIEVLSQPSVGGRYKPTILTAIAAGEQGEQLVGAFGFDQPAPGPWHWEVIG